MVRPRPRKTVEELYAPKYESNTNAAKHSNGHAGPNHGGGGATAKNKRPPEQEYAMPTGGGGPGFILNSTTIPLNGASMTTSRMQRGNASTSTGMTTRRKTTHQAQGAQATRYAKEEQDRLRLEELKKEHATLGPNVVKMKTCRMNGGGGGGGVEKVITNGKGGTVAATSVVYPSYSDEMKEPVVCGQLGHQHHHHNNNHHGQQQQQQHRHHQNGGPMMVEEDKEDETEEFFELIRMTVETAIGKAFSDLFNRNFRELSHKVDSLSSELKSTNELLAKVQTEVNNKVTHYGEENSRHFRYLCMKSEYDKMFYQHHAMMSNNATTAGQVPMPAKLPFPPTTGSAKGAIPKRERTDLTMKRPRQHDGSKTSVAGDGFATSRRAPTASGKEPYRTWSDERVLSPKSSEVCMRELLEHIQRFCNQLQLNELKPGEGEGAHANQSTATMCNEEENNLKASTSSYHTVTLMQTAVDQHQQQKQQQQQQQHHPFNRRPPSRLEESMKFTKRVFVGDEDDDDDDFGISSDGMSPRSEDENTPTAKGYSGGMTMRGSLNTGRANGAGGDS